MKGMRALGSLLMLAVAVDSAAEVGSLQSFSVTPVPGPGQIQLNLTLTTTGATTTTATDAVWMGAALFQPPWTTGSPTYLWSTFVFRDTPATFQHSFSFTVPPATAYKYLAGVAYPYPDILFTTLYSAYSTTIYLFRESSYTGLAVSTSNTDVSPYGTEFAALRGGVVTSLQLENIPVLTLLGFATLGLLIAAAGACLLRRA